MKKLDDETLREIAAYRDGCAAGETVMAYEMANQMRVLFCALITAHKRNDGLAFYATVEIVKGVLGKYVNFNEEHWAVFRRDIPMKDV